MKVQLLMAYRENKTKDAEWRDARLTGDDHNEVIHKAKPNHGHEVAQAERHQLQNARHAQIEKEKED